MTVVVRVENVSKKYQLGNIGTQSLKGDLNRWWARKRGKEDPYTKIGEESQHWDGEFWALKNISFDIHQGDTLGIIGKNGAGKSTLLKILSRITNPTIGSIKIKGRIASLLEVGTGFNPELTGRENIFLNGAILGMSKAEVKAKFDEIVAFSGVEQFIDTPVKRYSSGMYVRLAFAVAAHLESEILILDEVLAVGDAEFQKKCLKKMDDVTNRQGKTILFVSHSLPSLKQLCTSAILLEKGELVLKENTDVVISKYLEKEADFNRLNMSRKWELVNAPGNNLFRILEAEVVSLRNSIIIDTTTPFDIKIKGYTFLNNALLDITLHVLNQDGLIVFTTSTGRTINKNAKYFNEGVIETLCSITGNLMNDGIYTVNLLIVKDRINVIYKYENILSFEIVDDGKTRTGYTGKILGAIRPEFKWEYLQLNAVSASFAND